MATKESVKKQTVKKETSSADSRFSVEKLPLWLGVTWTILRAVIFGAGGAGLIIFLTKTF
ncbi:MAG: hypothetical protein GX220_02860 [Treponema sp.]|nr:hypothetical protein [Treponema sp.]